MNRIEPNREYTRFGWQIGYIVAANVIGLLFGFIRLPILTKGLGAALYGTWSLLDVTITLITPFALMGLHMGIVRFLAAERDRDRIREDFISTLTIVFISGIVFSTLLFLLSERLAVAIFKDASAAEYIKLASVIILLNSIITLNLDFFQAFRKIGLRTGMGLIQGALQVGLIALLIYLGYALTGVIAAYIISGIVLVLTTLVIILRQSGCQLPRFSRLGGYLRFSVPLTPNNAIMWIINASDRYIISYFMGVTATGVYSAAYAIGGYAAFLAMPIGVVLFPTIAKLYDSGDISETRTYLGYSVKYFMMIAIPAAAGLSILARPILQVLTTPEFMPGAIVVPFVAFGIIMPALYQIGEYVIMLAKKTTLLVMLLAISAVLNVVLNIILIPPMGILGAAVATVISYAVLGIATLVVSRRYLKFPIGLVFIIKSLVSSGVMVLCVWLIRPESIASVAISIAAGVVVYFGVLIALRGLSRGEIGFFVNFLVEKLRKIRR